MYNSLITEIHYLPCIAYFASLAASDTVVFEVQEHYVKQSYRNRCYILSANKVQMLSIPVQQGNKKVIFKDILIDHSQNWRKIHWRSICSAYGKAPFFEHYEAYFYDIFEKKHNYLLDLNVDLLTLCLKLLKIEKDLLFSKAYQSTPNLGILDNRSKLRPTIDPCSILNFKIIPYNQVFGKHFVSNLSIIDLLFCEGGEAPEILRRSTIP